MPDADETSPVVAWESDDDFTKLAKKFFSLDAYDKELDLFCSLTELEPTRGRLSRARDAFFWTLYSITRAAAGRNSRPDDQKETWAKRLKKWRCHIDAFLWIKEGKGRTESSAPRFDATVHGCKRLDVLFDHLKIIDSKFSMLLSVNSVLVALVALSLKELTDLFKEITVTDPFHFRLKWIAFTVLVGLLVWIIFHAFFNLWYGIRGFRRVVWGELDSEKGCMESEDEYSRFLIYSLARRTNLFRIVSESTRRGYKLFIWFALCAGVTLGVKTVDTWSSDWTLSHPAPKPPASAAVTTAPQLPAQSALPDAPPPNPNSGRKTGEKHSTSKPVANRSSSQSGRLSP